MSVVVVLVDMQASTRHTAGPRTLHAYITYKLLIPATCCIHTQIVMLTVKSACFHPSSICKQNAALLYNLSNTPYQKISPPKLTPYLFVRFHSNSVLVAPFGYILAFYRNPRKHVLKWPVSPS